MKNPHIIVGPNKQCLCGVYEGVAISCQEVIKEMEGLGEHRVVKTLKSRIEDCSEEDQKPTS